MTDIRNAILDRRQALECMIWAGAGVVWTVAGGVPTSRLIGEARAEVSGFSFVQISDSHVGFEKPVNPDARATLREAIVKTLALPRKPAFMIHTGDISHAAKSDEFDDAVQIIGEAKLDVHYAPGEHDILDPRTHAAYLARFGKGATDGGWYAFDQAGVHFVSLVNVVDLGKNGLGALGPDQLAWLDADRRLRAYPPLDDRAGTGMGRRGFGASPSNTREHIISVSELPAGGAATWRGAVAGYHIESWSDPERAYVAISDIDASELADFARAFRAAEPPPP